MDKVEFIAYNPSLRPLSSTQGGGFTLSVEISENEWPNIKELNNPSLKNKPFLISLKIKSK